MDGIIIINKPLGYTSQDVVSRTKKILNVKKAGHTGTLDPMATGVLPIMLGKCTKLSKYLIEHDKTYIATIKLGEKRDTGDSEGKVIDEKNVNINLLTKENIEKILSFFLGKQSQTPPMYSAIKINGKKLYEYARNNEEVEVPKREIEIYTIKLIEINLDNIEIKFEVKCSKGTYIRVLCEDIAEKLGTIGYMSVLNRILVDKFKIEDSVSLEELENKKEDKSFLKNKIISMEELFKKYPKIVLNKRKEELFLNGVLLTFDFKEGLYNIYSSENNYLGLGIIKNNLLKRDVIINE